MIDTIFMICCDIIRYISSILGISYSACNILIFLYILPTIYLLLSVGLGISGFFKKSKIFGLICMLISYILSLYFYECLFYFLSEFSLDVNSFNKSVQLLQHHSELLNCSYQEINILYFIFMPCLIISALVSLIFMKNRNLNIKINSN